jgi:hypothetical protein
MLAEEQFRFRKHLTTEKAFYKLINNDNLSALNVILILGGIFCDL